MEKNQASTLTLVKVDLDQNADSLINALHFCNETEIINPEIRKLLSTDIFFSILPRIQQPYH